MFDSRQYEFADMTVLVGGKDIATLRGIRYTEKIEREPLYGKGRYPLAIQTGNISTDGEISLLQSELDTLVKAGGGNLFSLNVSVEINYGNPANGDVMTTDRLEGVRFTETSKELKQGDKFMEVTLPFVALRVLRNV